MTGAPVVTFSKLRRISLDFETTSIANLKKVGAPRYSEDESTRVLVAAWSVGNAPPRCWIIGQDEPTELFALAADPNVTFVAWNSAFERTVWRRTFARQWPNAPEIPIERWSCSMTRGLVWGLPRALDMAGAAIGTSVLKDATGAKLMMKMSKP